MTKYVSVLEEWDDHVGNDWQNPDSNFLNPSDWIEQNDTELFNNVYKVLIDKAFDRCDGWKKKQFHPYLMNFWELYRLNLDEFKEFEMFDNAGLAFEKSLTQLTNYRDINEGKLPLSADLGLFRIDTGKLREKLLPAPQVCLEKLAKFMPGVILEKMNQVKQWMAEKYNEMKMGSVELEDFVQQ